MNLAHPHALYSQEYLLSGTGSFPEGSSPAISVQHRPSEQANGRPCKHESLTLCKWQLLLNCEAPDLRGQSSPCSPGRSLGEGVPLETVLHGYFLRPAHGAGWRQGFLTWQTHQGRRPPRHVFHVATNTGAVGCCRAFPQHVCAFEAEAEPGEEQH